MTKSGHSVMVYAPHLVKALTKSIPYLVSSDKLADLLLYRDSYPVQYDTFRRDVAKVIISAKCGHTKEVIDLNKTYEYIDTYNDHVSKSPKKTHRTRVSRNLPVKVRLSQELRENTPIADRRVKVARLKALNLLDSIMGRISKLTRSNLTEALSSKSNISSKVDVITKKADEWMMIAWMAVAIIQELINSLPDIGTALMKLFHMGDDTSFEGDSPEKIKEATYNIYTEEEQNADRLKFAQEDKEYEEEMEDLKSDYDITNIAKGKWYEKNLTEDRNGKTVIREDKKGDLAKRVIGRANDLYKDLGLKSKTSSTDKLDTETDDEYLERASKMLADAVRESESKSTRDRDRRVEAKIANKAKSIREDVDNTKKVLEDSSDDKNSWYISDGTQLSTPMYLEYRYNLEQYVKNNPNATDQDKRTQVFHGEDRLWNAYRNTDSKLSGETRFSLGKQMSNDKLVEVVYNTDKAVITYENPDKEGEIVQEFDIENKSDHISEIYRAMASRRDKLVTGPNGNLHTVYSDVITEHYMPVNKSTNAIVYTTNISYENTTSGAK